MKAPLRTALLTALAVAPGLAAAAPERRPNVVVARSGTPMQELSPEAIKGILVNPVYTGVGPFSRLVAS